MLRGLDLWRESCPSWEEGGSFLLLNPRLSETWRECVLGAEFPDLKDHVWLGTSGTSGTLKMVALARTALEANARAVNSHLGVTSRDVWLNPLPLFHVGGLGIVVRAALGGGDAGRLEIWSAQEFVRRATASADVPAARPPRCRVPGRMLRFCASGRRKMQIRVWTSDWGEWWTSMTNTTARNKHKP